VAPGVTPPGAPADADASHLIHGRSHRLETVDPALFAEFERPMPQWSTTIAGS
jgi:hypothetical protein